MYEVSVNPVHVWITCECVVLIEYCTGEDCLCQPWELQCASLLDTQSCMRLQTGQLLPQESHLYEISTLGPPIQHTSWIPACTDQMCLVESHESRNIVIQLIMSIPYEIGTMCPGKTFENVYCCCHACFSTVTRAIDMTWSFECRDGLTVYDLRFFLDV